MKEPQKVSDQATRTPVTTNYKQLIEVKEDLEHSRESLPKGDPMGRLYSITITKLEDAILWLLAAQRGKI